MRDQGGSLAPRFTAVALVVVGVGCAHTPPPQLPGVILEEVAAGSWPALGDDLEGVGLDEACAASLAYLDAVSPDRVFAFGAIERTAEELGRGVRRACELAVLPPGVRREALQREFILLRSVGRTGGGEVLFTGYYEPLIPARRDPSADFHQPIYGIPDDLITANLADFGVEEGPDRIVGRVDGRRLVPYPTRDEIDFGDGMQATASVLGWVKDPVDVFFLHVQGSGTLVFDDGRRLRAGYAATNGRPYRSIGRLLIDDGLVSREEMSMQAIRAYLRDHPNELRRVLSFNPSYVFFRPLPPADGPLGCYGQPVTAGRSIATDRRLFPAPVMAWIQATIPSSDGSDREIGRFVLNQDTGGSITGPGRVDLFFGQGTAAGELAGRTKHPGELYFLLPR